MIKAVFFKNNGEVGCFALADTKKMAIELATEQKSIYELHNKKELNPNIFVFEHLAGYAIHSDE